MDKVFDYIQANASVAIQLETLLTATKALAPENGGNGEWDKSLALEGYLKEHNIGTVAHYDAIDKRVPSGLRPNIVVTIPGKVEQGLWFIAHLDVVPVGDEMLWVHEPWKVTREGRKLYGRGVEDNTQGLCSAVLAAMAMKAMGQVPYYTTHLLFCSDEEVGSKYGIGYLLSAHKELFSKEDIIVIPDGGDSEGLCIEVAEKSVLWLRVTVTGKQSHGSRPDEGNNALLAACDLAMSINALEKELDVKNPIFTPDYSTFQPTLKEAGVSGYNIIPGADVFGVDCRVLPNYSLEDIKDKLRDKARVVEARYGVKISYDVVQETSSPATPEDSPAVALLSRAIRLVKGREPRLIGIGGGTVAAALRAHGYANCVVWSTLDDRAHTIDEYCVIDNLLSDAKVMAALMLG